MISVGESNVKKESKEQDEELFSSGLKENSVLVNDISEDTSNEELNKVLMVKIQSRENYTRLSTTWRSRAWNEEIQNMHHLSHNVSLILRDNNY